MPIAATQGLEPRRPCLERWLSRGNRSEVIGRDGLETLCGLFGVHAEPGCDLPTAPLTALGDGIEADTGGFWLHADPVFLRPDRDQLLLFDERVLDLVPAEAQALADLFNRHFADEGIRLHVPQPTRWYLEMPTSPGIQTRPIHQAIGRHIHPLLPSGENARHWIGLLNEAQMLFYGADVNREREAGGRPLISGVWLWGGGKLPAVKAPEGVGRVISDHPLAQGLAQQTGLPWEPLTVDWSGAGRVGDVVLFQDVLWRPACYADALAWRDALATLDLCCGGLDAGLTSGRLGEIRLYPCNEAVWTIGRHSRFRFWRRRLPLGRWLEGSS